MKYNFEILVNAQVEFSESLKWYDEQSEGLSSRLEAAVLRKINSILTQPYIYPNKRSDFRECKVDGFPFLIIYKINVDKKLVTVYSIFHTSKWPGKKYRKY